MRCYTTIAATASLLATAVVAQSPPNFSPAASAKLDLQFGNTTITPGQQIGINGPFPAMQPRVGAESALTGTYLLAIVDPDAPTPSNNSISQYLHWLQPGLRFSTTRNTTANAFTPYTATINAAATVPFTRPQPPPTSAAHRYIALLYAQPANFSVPADFVNFSASNRTKFNITRFASEAKLGNAVAANYFLVSNMTGNATTTKPGVAQSTGGAAVIQISLASVVIGAFSVILAL